MRHAAAKLHEWSRLPGRHKLAVAVLLMQAAVTFRIFFSFDPAWFAAQSTNYATLTTSAFLFAAASLGIRQWGDVQQQINVPPTSQPPAGEEPA